MNAPTAADSRTSKPGTVYAHVVEILRRFDTPTGRAIEIGCGANRYGGVLRAQHIGIDLWSHPYAGAPDVYADGRRLPFATSCADLVFMVAVLHHVSDVDAVLVECRRVLRTGGTLLVFDYNRATTARLKRAGAGMQVWSPRALRRRVAAAGFRAASVWDYALEPGSGWKRALVRSRAVRYLRHVMPLNEGWNIVVGTK